MEEEWRPVKGFEGLYQVSSLGRMQSIPREDYLGRPVKGWVKTPGVSGNGYPTVVLWRQGKGFTRTVHSLVAEAFLGPRPEGFDVAHKDGTRTNNEVGNLRYLSRKDNLKEARLVHKTMWQESVTHCLRGHKYKGSNLKLKKDGKGVYRYRECRACSQERSCASAEGREFNPEKADMNYLNRLKKNGE